MRIVIFGLSITSSWGNGHATTFRALVRALASRGHDVVFFERDVRWYASHRDLPSPSYCTTILYGSLDELAREHRDALDADLVIVGSYVPDAIALTEWIRTVSSAPLAFYDIDTPVTLAALERGDCQYLTRDSIRGYDLFLSFAGGAVLDRLRDEFRAPMVRPLYCSVDIAQYAPMQGADVEYELGYLGTYSDDRQPTLDRHLLEVARRREDRRFVVAGAQYPDSIDWPANVDHIDHLPPAQHRHFYNTQRITINVTRADMIASGWSPSVRLFEAAACGVPIISDWFEGLDDFFEPGRDILIACSTDDVLAALHRSDPELRRIGESARERVLAQHTSDHRAAELESYVNELAGSTLASRE